MNESKKFKAVVKKSLKQFILNITKLMKSNRYEEVKSLTEKAIKDKTYGEIAQDPKIYLYCGTANLKLGYLIIAQEMFKRCIAYPEV